MTTAAMRALRNPMARKPGKRNETTMSTSADTTKRIMMRTQSTAITSGRSVVARGASASLHLKGHLHVGPVAGNVPGPVHLARPVDHFHARDVAHRFGRFLHGHPGSVLPTVGRLPDELDHFDDG